MFASNLSITIDSSTWQWSEWEGLPYLTCELLKDWQHGFFTQQSYPRTPEDLIVALNKDAAVYRVKQVHGNRILTPQEIITTAQGQEVAFPDADGIITDGTSQGIWVASADCNPVLIGDRTTGRVAAIHAGWRGTAQRIVPNAIALFQAAGSDLADLRIAIGPAISGEVYQVGENVAAQVGQSILKERIDRDFPSKPLYEESKEAILQELLAMENSPLLKDEQPGRVKLDVRRVNQIQLQQLGINNEQIAIAPYCTYQQSDYFFSYRRSKQKKVQWSGIVSK
jgi:YfiH family protein